MNMKSHPFNAGLIVGREKGGVIIATKDSYMTATINSDERLVGRRLITYREELEEAKVIPIIRP